MRRKASNEARFFSRNFTRRLADGSFIMHADGEVDIRGTYCALSIARMTNVFSPELFENTDQWLLR